MHSATKKQSVAMTVMCMFIVGQVFVLGMKHEGVVENCSYGQLGIVDLDQLAAI